MAVAEQPIPVGSEENMRPAEGTEFGVPGAEAQEVQTTPAKTTATEPAPTPVVGEEPEKPDVVLPPEPVEPPISQDTPPEMPQMAATAGDPEDTQRMAAARDAVTNQNPADLESHLAGEAQPPLPGAYVPPVEMSASPVVSDESNAVATDKPQTEESPKLPGTDPLASTPEPTSDPEPVLPAKEQTPSVEPAVDSAVSRENLPAEELTDEERKRYLGIVEELIDMESKRSNALSDKLGRLNDDYQKSGWLDVGSAKRLSKDIDEATDFINYLKEARIRLIEEVQEGSEIEKGKGEI